MATAGLTRQPTPERFFNAVNARQLTEAMKAAVADSSRGAALLLCIRARLQSGRKGLRENWALHAAEKLCTGHERRTSGARARRILNHLRPD